MTAVSGFQWVYCEHVAGVFLSFLHDNIKCWLCAVAFLPLIVQYARLLLANEVTTEVPAHSDANRPGSNRSGEVIHPWAHLDRPREKCDDMWQDVGHHVTAVGISSTTASLVASQVWYRAGMQMGMYYFLFNWMRVESLDPGLLVVSDVLPCGVGAACACLWLWCNICDTPHPVEITWLWFWMSIKFSKHGIHRCILWMPITVKSRW